MLVLRRQILVEVAWMAWSVQLVMATVNAWQIVTGRQTAQLSREMAAPLSPIRVASATWAPSAMLDW